jgi:hypothetical protein
MEPGIFVEQIIDPGLEFLASIDGPASTNHVRRFLLCIAMQESGPKLDARYQGSPASSPGPARGWWQFEQGGGVAGVLQHTTSRTLARDTCTKLTVVAEPPAVWRALEGHDLLACVFARLLVLTDPKAVPADEKTGWDYYLRTWRPGKPHQDTWPTNWQNATSTISSEP